MASGLAGTWRIVDFDGDDDPEELDLDEMATFELDDAGRGWLHVHVLDATIDGRRADDGIEFTWSGTWELDDVCGRGLARIEADGTLTVDLHIHLGDDFRLRAVPFGD